SRVLADALFLVQTQFRRKSVRVEEDFAAELPPARGIRNKLQQVAVNLLQNAFQAVGDGGLVRLATRASGGFVDMVVSDDGPGIPAETRDRIFDPFFTTKPTGIGTGLGLSITYGIVQEHGGSIELQGHGRDGGATFTVHIPMEEGQGEPCSSS
ncbi:MAG: two-component sensor histidine kinase, partial [Deltaproteobacteria bacterium]|nr:two-component sensor histidine kinase [Deltaproteobacteria bacterium]